MQRISKVFYALLLSGVLFLSLMSGCGGGGGGGGGTPVPPADTTPPAVISTTPANGDSGVAVGTAIAATFSEAVDPATVNVTNFTLDKSVTGAITYDSVNKIATFMPLSSLEYSTTYTATITTGVKDVAGNAMAANHTWTFTTGNAPDTAPPSVTSTNPGNSASGVIRNTPIRATFSEFVDCSTVTTNNFYLSNGVTGSLSCSGTTVTFTPSNPLAPNTPYTVTITTGVKDLAGNAMASDDTWTFTTGASLAWAKSYSGGYARSVYETSDGGYIVAGWYSGGLTYSYAYWIIKVDIQGNVQWQKAYDGMGDFAESIQQTADGGFIVAGFSWNYGTGGAQGTWILKLDSAGNSQWQKSYSFGGVAPRAYAIRQTNDGGYIVAGEWYISSTDSDMWAMKLDSNGQITWQKRYVGGLIEVPSSLEQTADGGYVFAGSWWWPTLGSNALVLKLDSNGDITWQRSYGDPDLNEYANSIKQTSEGGYVVAGHTNSAGAGGYDAWVFKLDANGTIVWQKTYGGSLADGANSIQQTSDGGYTVAGYTNSAGAGGSDVWALKLDTTGAVVWQKTYGGESGDNDSTLAGHADFVRQTTDGGYIIATTSDSFGGIWLLKITDSGFIGFDPQSTAVSAETSVLAVDSNVEVGQTFATASDISLFTANTNAPITNTMATVQQQAP